MIDILVPKYRDDPNAKVHSLYHGVSANGGTVTAVTKPSVDGKRLETTRVYGAPLPRGQGGQIGILILGGMETTLDEVRDILAAKREKKFVPRRSGSEIAEMCRMVQARRNEEIMRQRQHSTQAPKKKVRLLLPVGYRMEQTSVPGLRVRVRS